MGALKAFSAALGILALAGCAAAGPPPRATLPAGAGYVAMGSSFGSGPGVLPMKADAPARCQRSARNYASLLAERLGLRLSDVTCGGATTVHVLEGWGELPPQIDAVQPDTRLVTVTIGGNDVNYVRNLMAASCRQGQRCIPREAAGDAAWARGEANMRAIVRGARQRAPQARVVFVDYVTLLPAKGSCPAVEMDAADLETGRAVAKRLAALTARIAREEGAEVLAASALSRGHTACDPAPWSVGAVVTDPAAGGMIWHPNTAGHAVIADALAARLSPAR